MRKWSIIIVVSILLLGAVAHPTELSAQTESATNFDHLSTQDGLSDATALSIIQDVIFPQYYRHKEETVALQSIVELIFVQNYQQISLYV